MARENKTGINSSFLFHNSWEIVYYTIHDFLVFLRTQLVLIERISIGFKAILKNIPTQVQTKIFLT